MENKVFKINGYSEDKETTLTIFCLCNNKNEVKNLGKYLWDECDEIEEYQMNDKIIYYNKESNTYVKLNFLDRIHNKNLDINKEYNKPQVIFYEHGDLNFL